jgi:hypothetical protein
MSSLLLALLGALYGARNALISMDCRAIPDRPETGAGTMMANDGTAYAT